MQFYEMNARSFTSRREIESVGALLLNGGNRNTLGLCLPLALRYRMIRDCCAGVVSFHCALLLLQTHVYAIFFAKAYLHDVGIMHCDVKSLNFLVSNDFVIKLADLGEARPFRAKISPEETKLMPK